MFIIHSYLLTSIKVDDPIRIFLMAKTVADIMKQDSTLSDATTGKVGLGVGPIGPVSDMAFLRFIEINNLPHANEDRVVKVQGSARTPAGLPYTYVLYALIVPVPAGKAAAPEPAAGKAKKKKAADAASKPAPGKARKTKPPAEERVEEKPAVPDEEKPADESGGESAPAHASPTEEIIREWGKKRDIPNLISTLENADQRLRKTAVEQLEDIAGPEDTAAVEPLIRFLNRGGETYQMMSAIIALRKIGDPRAVDAIVPFAGMSDSDVRHCAVRALGEIGGPKALDIVRKAVKDSCPEVRELAGKILAKAGGNTDSGKAATAPSVAKGKSPSAGATTPSEEGNTLPPPEGSPKKPAPAPAPENPAPPAGCPECGSIPGRISLRKLTYTCPHCQAAMEFPERSLPRGGGANLLCGFCRKSLHVSERMWCDRCHAGLKPNAEVQRIIAEENGIDPALLSHAPRLPNAEDMERAARQLLGPNFRGSQPASPPSGHQPTPPVPTPPPAGGETPAPSGNAPAPTGKRWQDRLRSPLILFGVILGLGTIGLLVVALLGQEILRLGADLQHPAATSIPTMESTTEKPVFFESGMPVVNGVILREESLDGEMVIYQDILLQDPDGDITYLDIRLVSSTNPNVNVLPGFVDIPREEQIRGAVWRGDWNCGGGVYDVTLSVTPWDSAGHVGRAFEYTMECR
jgi:hypothetical protein